MGDCTLCRLHEQCSNILQMGNGKKSARIMVVQESPYQAENKRNQYMGGKAGKMFKTALSEVGIDLDDVYFTSLVKCSTPDDRLPLKDEVAECQDYLFAEIDAINPEIIVPTGNLSLKALVNKTAITKVRGMVIEKDGRKYLPIIHPNMVLKQPKHLENFSEDMITLESTLNGTDVTHRSSYKKERLYCDTYELAIGELKRLMNLPKGHKIVVDLETVKANPFIDKVSASKRTKELYPGSTYPKIVGIGFSDRSGYGCAIPLYHRETPFNFHTIGTIIKFIRFLFENTDLEFVAHNGKFDIKWLRSWLDVVVDKLIWDPMLMHYLTVTEERGTHDLKQLAWLETDMGGYDDALDDVKPKGEDEGNYDLIPWEKLKVYLADDCDVTYRILDKYLPNFEDDTFHWLWHNLMQPGYYTLLDIEENGMHVNREWLNKLKETYPKELDRIHKKLHEFPEVLEMERERMDKWEERVAIGKIKKANRTPEQHERFVKWKKYDPSKGGCEVNFGSPAQLSELLFDRLGLTTPIKTDKGAPSTKDESLKYMQNQSKIIDTLLEFRKVNHLNNNFVSGMEAHIDGNNIAHPSYNIHGTVTGRLSSNEPNAQQFPRKSYDVFSFQYWNEIKAMFNSRFGDDGVIMQFDYSQLELRILAVFSQDRKLIELYRSGADLHTAVASDAFSIPLEEVTKDRRTAAKKIQFGIVYQESPEGLSEDLAAEGITMSVEECRRFINNYFAKYKGVQKWINDIKRFAKRNKYVTTLTGRVRHLASIDSVDYSIASEAERQAVNAPIQSSGSDCTLMSLIIINRWLKENGYRSVVFVTVHDSIGLDSPKSEAIEVANKVKHIMENLAEYNEKYKFLGDVPIVSEMEIGYNYGTMFECEISDLEEQGIDNFIQSHLDAKHKNEEEAYKKAEEEGVTIPNHVEGYWANLAS